NENSAAAPPLPERTAQRVFTAPSPLRLSRVLENPPQLVLAPSLFIKTRGFFAELYPQGNPAVEWDRFGLALFDTLARTLGFNARRAGGSTLATQLEKFRHSPDGRTVSALEKLRQMGSASLRAYLEGPNTMPARQAIALAYVNSVPLGGIAGYGEIHGLGDGLWAWYGVDFATMNR